MKTIKLFLITTILLCSASFVSAQSVEVPYDIISALNDGDANMLSGFLNANVELVIDNKNDVFSKQQATGIVSDFFRKNRTGSFQLLHKGTKDAASFAIGTLKTSSGNFRVYVLTRKVGGQTVIQQLRIEPSND
jgi:hypothetical protein